MHIDPQLDRKAGANVRRTPSALRATRTSPAPLFRLLQLHLPVVRNPHLSALERLRDYLVSVPWLPRPVNIIILVGVIFIFPAPPAE
ncbi:hypothetical protein BOTBODRAFT_31536 [Botryobasidium botryosum FD-172 SS1]|uniref:Uncharacterized protein n=1 Tax=Botryobasidium botryosum (strain FD-172 SS1) TaxID=930990 RepID=A0A067MJA8_BOTB1|nr:hypothetical protein BOTBODRAFT_31536 [Botryobasidium botryosum FD-172 SS1]